MIIKENDIYVDKSHEELIQILIVFAQLVWDTFYRWDQLKHHIQFTRMDYMTLRIIKICLATMVYKIWNERNCRSYGDKPFAASSIAQDCINIIKCKLFPVKKFSKFIERLPFLRVWQLQSFNYNICIISLFLMFLLQLSGICPRSCYFGFFQYTLSKKIKIKYY